VHLLQILCTVLCFTALCTRWVYSTNKKFHGVRVIFHLQSMSHHGVCVPRRCVPYQLYILWCLCTLSAITYIQWCLHIIPWCMCTLSAVRTMVSVYSINSNYHGFCVLKNQPAMVAFLLSAVRTTASVYSAAVIRVHVLYELYILVSFSCTYHGSV
jgi:hypothetical protein